MSGGLARLLVVIDTNLFISGTIIKRGQPFELLELWRQQAFRLLISTTQMRELEDVLRRPHWSARYGIAPDEIDRLLVEIRKSARRASQRRRLPIEVRDPKDAHLSADAATFEGSRDAEVHGS